VNLQGVELMHRQWEVAEMTAQTIASVDLIALFLETKKLLNPAANAFTGVL